MEIKKVGVVGCGYMGGGIAQVAAQVGYDIVVTDANEQLVKKGLSVVEANLNRSVERGRMTQQDKNAIMGRIKGSTDMKVFSDRDLVIEAVTENLDLKRKIISWQTRLNPTVDGNMTNFQSKSLSDKFGDISR